MKYIIENRIDSNVIVFGRTRKSKLFFEKLNNGCPFLKRNYRIRTAAILIIGCKENKNFEYQDQVYEAYHFRVIRLRQKVRVSKN